MILKFLKSTIKNNNLIYNFYFKYFYEFYHETNNTLKYFIDKKKNPPPDWLKHKVILENSFSNSTFIETGTFRGSTLLAVRNKFKKIYSFEPSKKFYTFSKIKLKKFTNIKILNKTSEDGLSILLKKIQGNVIFWLDGHYSGGETFQGESKTPIKYELDTISKFIKNFKNLIIMVDDYRLFGVKPYPSKKYLINFCKKHGYSYKIECDIFIIKSK